MPGPPKKTKPTIRVLEAFLENPAEAIHGFDLIKLAKIKSGTLYPLLIRLENLDWLTSEWEESALPGAPRKRMYRLTAQGAPAARRLLEEAGATRSKTRPDGFPLPAGEVLA